MGKLGATQKKIARKPIKIKINWRWPLFFLFILALILLVFFVKQFKWLEIRHIQVSGDLYYQDRRELELLADQYFAQQDLFNLDLQEKQQLLKHLPWVDDVVIAYQWPYKLSLQVSEHFPVCIWNTHYLLNEYGEILPQIAVELELPRLIGEENQAAMVMQKYNLLSQRLLGLNFSVKSLEYKSYGSWVLIGQHGVEVRMTNSNFNTEFERLALWLTNNQENMSQVVRIDTRYQYGLSVQYKQGIEG